jgi:kynurenine formamidase
VRDQGQSDAVPAALRPGVGPWDLAWLRAEGKRLSNAGRWGDADQLGSWNCVTPDKVADAARCVCRGAVFSLALEFGPDLPVLPGRPAPVHFLTLTGTDLMAGQTGDPPVVGFADDWVTMNLSCGTQWDGFTHVFFDGTTYNDTPAAAVSAHRGAARCSVAALAGTVATRAVLLDIARLAGRPWLEPGEAITPQMLDDAEASAGVVVGAGDVVLIRTGALSRVRMEQAWGDYAGLGPQPGLSVSTAAWFAGRDVAAVATDTWGVEVLPYEVTGTRAPLHQLLLARCGITLGEMFDLDALATDCAADGIAKMQFVGPPLPIRGAVNSPVNPLALK